jgi:hypothetical protein
MTFGVGGRIGAGPGVGKVVEKFANPVGEKVGTLV